MSYKPTRQFYANEGDWSVDDAGPEALKRDFDEINKMFDPTAEHDNGEQGGISEENLNFEFADEGFAAKIGNELLPYLGTSQNVSEQLRAIASILETLEDSKQDNLTFDDVPVAESTNPVKSGGVKTAIDDAIEEFDHMVDDAIEEFDHMVDDATDEWLTNHPEATTTVQDGAVGESKLNDYVKNKLFEKRLDTYFIPDAETSGSGDTCFVITQTGKTILFDVGNLNTYSQKIVGFLEYNNITHIDNIIISHYHPDHVGGYGVGLSALINSNYVNSDTRIFLPHGQLDFNNVDSSIRTAYNTILSTINQNGYTPIYPSEEGEEYVIDKNVKIAFYNVSSDYWDDYYLENRNANGFPKSQSGCEYNNFCMCTLLDNDGTHYFYSGDIYSLAQSKIASEIDYVDVYKIEHHGVNHAVSEEFQMKINPKVAVACCAFPNFTKIYGITPSLARIANTSRIYTTGDSGLIHIVERYKEIKVITEFGDANGFSFNSTGQALCGEIDFNNIKTPGMYFTVPSQITSLSNAPSPSGGPFSVFVFSVFYTYFLQVIYYANNDKLYFRRFKNVNYWDGGNAFGKWHELVTGDEHYKKINIFGGKIEVGQTYSFNNPPENWSLVTDIMITCHTGAKPVVVCDQTVNKWHGMVPVDSEDNTRFGFIQFLADVDYTNNTFTPTRIKQLVIPGDTITTRSITVEIYACSM